MTLAVRHTWFMVGRQLRNLSREPIWLVLLLVQNRNTSHATPTKDYAPSLKTKLPTSSGGTRSSMSWGLGSPR